VYTIVIVFTSLQLHTELLSFGVPILLILVVSPWTVETGLQLKSAHSIKTVNFIGIWWLYVMVRI
jgi:hypothetical protein